MIYCNSVRGSMAAQYDGMRTVFDIESVQRACTARPSTARDASSLV